MPLTLFDFVQQVENVTVQDIPDSIQDSIDDELRQQTSGDENDKNDNDLTNPSDARIVADTVADLNDRAGFTSIQDAIDGINGKNGAPVKDGDTPSIEEDGTIFVEPGTYSESVTLGTSGVTLKGPNAGIAGDNDNRGSGEDEAEITEQVVAEASNVVIDGLSVLPPDPESDTARAEAIRISNSAGNVVVQNNIVENFDRSSGSGFFGVDGINIFGGDKSDAVESPTVKRNLVRGLSNTVSGGAAGISVQGNVNSATVEQNTVRDIGESVTNFGFGVVIRGTGNHDVTPSDVTVTDNEITNVISDPNAETVGVGVGVEASGASEVSITDNTISNTGFLLEDKTASLSVTDFANSNTLDRGALLEGAKFGDAERNVIFNRIQNAEEAATNGDQIELIAGSYSESVTINVKGLTIKAANGANPTVDASGIDGGSIPVLVDGVDNVTVDNANINFQSGIDVGANFSGYEPGLSESEADFVVPGDESSIGSALNKGGSDTSILVKSGYDSSNENEDLQGSNSALISVVQENVQIISKNGPDETVIDDRPADANGGRPVDISAANVVFKGFDLANAAQEGIFVKGVTEASGIEITDNKIQSDNSAIVVSDFPPDGADSASTNGILIKNNRINHERKGITLAFGAENSKIRGNTIIGAGNNYQNITLENGGNGVTNAIIKANLITDSNDEVVGTKRGLLVANDNPAAVDELSNNHFTGSGFVIQYLADTDIDASQNWFGTEERGSINTFADNQVDDDVGSINIDPFAGAPIDPDAGN